MISFLSATQARSDDVARDSAAGATDRPIPYVPTPTYGHDLLRGLDKSLMASAVYERFEVFVT